MTSKGSGIRIIYFDEKQKLTTSIRNITIESVESFQDLSSCISFIEQQTQENNVVILITTIDDNNILEIFQSLTSIEAILILLKIDKDINTFPSKVTGVYLQIETLLRSIPEIINTIQLQLNSRSILFNRYIDQYDNPDFYFYPMWKNEYKYKRSTKKSLANQARYLFHSNNQIRKFIDDFQTIYKPREISIWLDKYHHPFPYYLLISNALRTHNEEILSLSRFFLNHLSHQMSPVPPGISYQQVYLGTKLPINLIDRFEHHTKDDLIAFQCFLLVTQSRSNALFNATKSSRDDRLINVLFKIEINDALCIILGDKLLIDMATPFRIKYITKSIGSNEMQQLLIIIKLIALKKNERKQLYEQFNLQKQSKFLQQKSILKFRNDEALADEHIARGEWSQAADIFAHIINPNVRILNKYGCLLREHLDNLLEAFECHQQALLIANDREKAETLIYLGKVYYSMKEYNKAFNIYSEALEWFENEEIQDPIMIADCLVGLGNIQRIRGQLHDALDYIERALAIREHKIKPKNDFDIAACLGNMGNILHDQGHNERALVCAKRSVDLLSICGKGDPRYAAALNNLGAMYQANDDLVKARECFQCAVECLPNENHPYHESTLANIRQLNLIEQK